MQKNRTAVITLKFNAFASGDVESGIIDSLMAENAAAKKQIDKLLDLYMADIIDKETYQQRIAEYEKTIRCNKALIETETGKISDRPSTTIDYLRQRHAEYAVANKKEKRAILNLLIDYISIDNDKINIKWRVKWLKPLKNAQKAP